MNVVPDGGVRDEVPAREPGPGGVYINRHGPRTGRWRCIRTATAGSVPTSSGRLSRGVQRSGHVVADERLARGATVKSGRLAMHWDGILGRCRSCHQRSNWSASTPRRHTSPSPSASMTTAHPCTTSGTRTTGTGRGSLGRAEFGRRSPQQRDTIPDTPMSAGRAPRSPISRRTGLDRVRLVRLHQLVLDRERVRESGCRRWGVAAG